MEWEMERNIRGLIREFVSETENGFYKSVYDRYYATVAISFADEVGEYCKVVVFGDEYAMSVQELYTFDRDRAIEEWRDYVSRSLEDFPDWVEQCIRGDIEDFISEFQQWLAKQDSEEAANAAVTLMTGDVDLTEIVVDWLYGRLGCEDWKYPA